MRHARGRLYFLSILLVAASFLSIFQVPTAYAASIQNRSLTLVANGANGGSAPGVAVNHKFQFNVATAGTLGSIKFEYCTTSTDVGAGTCTAPTGMNASPATFGNETGSAVAGFSMGAKTANSFILTRTAAAVAGGALVVVQANSITNPTPTNYTFFVRITTYTGTDGATGPTDTGTVAGSTATAIVLTGIMPESIIFCTGATVGLTLGIPDCTTATAGTINFNQLFSPSDTATASSQMAASTNSPNGYVITVNGALLTSGSATIPSISTTAATAPTRGISQFGLNLKLNTTAVATPAVGAEINPASTGTDLRGEAATGYSTVNQFKFLSGDTIATSTNGGAGTTNAQIYTASYIVNVAGNQLAGTYTTTLTYICTATF